MDRVSKMMETLSNILKEYLPRGSPQNRPVRVTSKPASWSRDL